MVNIFVPILSYYILNNKTIEANYESKAFFYDLKLDSVHLNTVQGFTTKLVEMEKGTNLIHVKIGGIDVDALLNGSLKLIKFIPLSASALKINGLNIEFTLEPVAQADKIHWTLKDTTKFSFDSMKLTMQNKIIQKIVDALSGTIAKVINKELPKTLGKMIDGSVQNLNKELLDEEHNPLAFAVNLAKGAAVNLTMTQAPDLSTQDLVKIYFDGLILENNKTYENVKGIKAPPRLEHSLSEQIWLHERMVDSLLDAGASEIFPINVASEGISNQMKQVFSEIPAYYGHNVKIALKVNMDTGAGQAISFNTKDGIVLGDKQAVVTTIDIVCSNETAVNETAATLSMNLETHLNFSILEFIAYPKVENIYVAGAKVVKDNIGMYAHNYNILFTNILKNFGNDINMKYAKGYPLANIDPTIGLIGGLLKDFTLSPFFADGYMLLGWKMFADMPTVAPPVLIQ